MDIFQNRNSIEISNEVVSSKYKILESRKLNGIFLVIYDYMDFPKNSPAKNLYAYDETGSKLWRAKDIGKGATDAYTNILKEQPLKVGNFAGYSVTIDVENGAIIDTEFTK